ncbi:DNA polymerase III [Clostridium sp. DMHC 10]|uniref:ATP-dependent DNA helicase n=1 Tax=Clostridium sp. DMHC 10 TaxID=747377 RepID=UPI00069E9F23|nr:ATP-dependent DNA helicase [Clostridium sp. DMHC 10]KOF56772.1 DNA polymerase III [Clostridium sp. DMHC 10]
MKPYSILNNLVFLNIKTANDNKLVKVDAVKIKNKIVTKFNKFEQLSEIKGELKIFAEDLPLVCHDSTFAKSILNVGSKFLDSLELVAILFPEFPEFNLQYLKNKFVTKYKDISIQEELIEVLNYVISRFYSENGYAIPMNILELEHWNWYKYISSVNMDDVKCFVDNKPAALENKEREPYPVFALKDYEKLFENEAIWKRGGRSYTLRPQQRDAAKVIREGLEKGKITIMEAPTGLGKSMAYLLPYIIYTHLKQEKVILSTNTKGLQGQLVDKDIPNILEALDLKRDVNYTLIKGKSNYLCFDRFEDIEYPSDMKTLLGYVYLKRLLTEKQIGDIEDISDEIKEKFNLNELLEQCFCDSELCDVDSCKYKERCYYALKVEALKEAQLIVVNHSLLLKWPYQSIVPLQNLVVDEAHNLTEEAYDTFESNLISYEFEKFLKDIYNSEEKNGYLYYLSKRTKKENLPLSEIESDIETCRNEIISIKSAFEKYVSTSGISREYNIKEHLNKLNPKIARIMEHLDYLKGDISKFNMDLEKAITTLKNISTLEKDKRLKILVEKVETMNDYIRLLEEVCIQSEEAYCFYFEVDRNLQWWKISSIPLDVSGAFYEKVLKGVNSCLFLSATLSTDKGYNNLRNTLGINIASSENKEIVEVPPIKPIFKYKEKSAVYAVQGMDPNDADAFSEEMEGFILELLNNVEGNIIVLFTSIKRLKVFKEKAAEKLKALGISIVESKKDIEKLKSREGRYILLGSKGFFEGIDIPGDTMATVVLDKLPNINGKEPFYKSLIDKNIEKGKNYWNAYAAVNFPIVSIDLKQIYGRIIRTEYDYGALFIMSKFDSNNSTVRKLEKQLYGVPIIRKNKHEIFKDLNYRRVRWKQINLYQIMKEVKAALKKSILEEKPKGIKHIEKFINEFMALEYGKRYLKYDASIQLEEKLEIYICGKKVNLGVGRKNIEEYFRDICYKN